MLAAQFNEIPFIRASLPSGDQHGMYVGTRCAFQLTGQTADRLMRPSGVIWPVSTASGRSTSPRQAAINPIAMALLALGSIGVIRIGAIFNRHHPAFGIFSHGSRGGDDGDLNPFFPLIPDSRAAGILAKESRRSTSQTVFI